MIHTPWEEVLRYLGYGKSAPEAAAEALIARETAAVEAAASPRWLALPLPCAVDSETVHLGDWQIQSRDLAAHLVGCGSALLFAATLGPEVDRRVARGAAGRVAQAAVAQAAAAALMEAVCDQAEEELAVRYPGQSLRPRFSPGYGDFSLSAQETLLRLLDAPKKIGLTVTDAYLLAPTKSVTAVIGVGPAGTGCTIGGCRICKKTNCTFRR